MRSPVLSEETTGECALPDQADVPNDDEQVFFFVEQWISIGYDMSISDQNRLYKRLAMLLHPDKCRLECATRVFQHFVAASATWTSVPRK